MNNHLSVSAKAGSTYTQTPASKAVSQPQQEAKAVPPKEPEHPKLHGNPEEQRRAVQEAVDAMNRLMQAQNRSLSFEVDKVAQHTVVTVRDQQSNEIVRQIPNEAVLRVAHNIEAMKGLMHDRKA